MQGSDMQSLGATIRRNVEDVRERIARACEEVGRDPAEVTLVAVSKTVAVQRVVCAHEMGIRDFGENRVQEAAAKIRQVTGPVTWHMVGHLQTNKARQAVSLFGVIQSVDSVRLARAINVAVAAMDARIPILLEVNVSGESTKYGFTPDDVAPAVQEIYRLPGLRIQGLMTIAPIVSRPDEARPYFARLRHLRDQLQVSYPDIDWRHLSMGMTDDFEAAIKEGATIVRIGRAIFGERPAVVEGAK